MSTENNENTEVVDRGDTLDDDGAGAAAEAEAALAAAEAERVAELAAAGETDPDADPAAEGDDKKPKKDSRIPLARHKELLEKERSAREAVEAQLAKFQGGEKVAATNADIEATEAKLLTMEESYTKALAEGEMEKATKLMSDIRRLERTIGDQKSDMKALAAEARAVERVRYDVVVERLEAAYPALNPDSDEFDKGQTVEVMELKSAYESTGLTPTAALQKAVKLIMRAETAKQEAATTITPRASAEDVAKQRKSDALKRNVDAANKTPANTAKIGADSDKVGGVLTPENIMNLSQAEFAKLDEKALSKARGDTL